MGIPVSEERLPEGWTESTIGELTESPKSVTYGVLKPGPRITNGIPLLRVKDIDNWQIIDDDIYGISEDLHQQYSRTHLLEDDVLISVQGSVGKIAIVPDQLSGANISRTLAVIRPTDTRMSRWIWYALRSPHVQSVIEENTTGTTRDSLNLRDLRDLQIPIAPLPEQKRIVAKLDEIMAEIKAAKEHLARAKELIRKFRQSVLNAAVTGKLTEEWRKDHPDGEPSCKLLRKIIEERKRRGREGPYRRRKSSQSSNQAIEDLELFEVPKSWTWAIWNDLVDWITYGFTRPMPHVDKGIPIITAKNINEDKIDFSVVDFTTSDAFEELSDKDIPRKGEILITKDGSIGRTAIVTSDEPFCVNQSVAVLRFGGMTAYVPYLKLLIDSEFTQRLIEEGAKGTAIRHISITTFGSFPVPLPPMEEQVAIVDRATKLLNDADAIYSMLLNSNKRMKLTVSSCHSKAFRGELI